MTNNKTNKTICCICGAEYEVCHFCPDVANFTSWRRICDTQDHYKIYLILSEYDGGILNKSEALEKFKNINVELEDCEQFKPHIYKVIKDIFLEDKKKNQKNIIKHKSESDLNIDDDFKDKFDNISND